MITAEMIVDIINDRIADANAELKDIQKTTGQNCPAFSMALGARDELVYLLADIAGIITEEKQ